MHSSQESPLKKSQKSKKSLFQILLVVYTSISLKFQGE